MTLGMTEFTVEIDFESNESLYRQFSGRKSFSLTGFMKLFKNKKKLMKYMP
jgi:hypothetical protein